MFDEIVTKEGLKFNDLEKKFINLTTSVNIKN